MLTGQQSTVRWVFTFFTVCIPVQCLRSSWKPAIKQSLKGSRPLVRSSNTHFIEPRPTQLQQTWWLVLIKSLLAIHCYTCVSRYKCVSTLFEHRTTRLSANNKKCVISVSGNSQIKKTKICVHIHIRIRIGNKRSFPYGSYSLTYSNYGQHLLCSASTFLSEL